MLKKATFEVEIKPNAVQTDYEVVDGTTIFNDPVGETETATNPVEVTATPHLNVTEENVAASPTASIVDNVLSSLNNLLPGGTNDIDQYAYEDEDDVEGDDDDDEDEEEEEDSEEDSVEAEQEAASLLRRATIDLDSVAVETKEAGVDVEVTKDAAVDVETDTNQIGADAATNDATVVVVETKSNQIGGEAATNEATVDVVETKTNQNGGETSTNEATVVETKTKQFGEEGDVETKQTIVDIIETETSQNVVEADGTVETKEAAVVVEAEATIQTNNDTIEQSDKTENEYKADTQKIDDSTANFTQVDAVKLELVPTGGVVSSSTPVTVDGNKDDLIATKVEEITTAPPEETVTEIPVPLTEESIQDVQETATDVPLIEDVTEVPQEATEQEKILVENVEQVADSAGLMSGIYNSMFGGSQASESRPDAVEEPNDSVELEATGEQPADIVETVPLEAAESLNEKPSDFDEKTPVFDGRPDEKLEHLDEDVQPERDYVEKAEIEAPSQSVVDEKEAEEPESNPEERGDGLISQSNEGELTLFVIEHKIEMRKFL